ncbi:hypothetical protein DFH09DRAFT_918962, partial [Mycena vulgaris]
ILQVRGTPGSGKTTLCSLLFNHILNKEDESLLSCIGPWRQRASFWESISTSCIQGDIIDSPQWREGRKRHWILFDEAQTTYEDEFLWSRFLKELENNNFIVVLFASYGSQQPSRGVARVIGTPNNIQVHQCMGLRATENGLLVPYIPGLYFTPEEFETFLEEQIQKSDLPALSEDLGEWIYGASRGHIGAIDSVLLMVKLVAVCMFHGYCTRTLCRKRSGSLLCPWMALAKCAHGSAFDRGLPRKVAITAQENIPAIQFIHGLLESGPLSCAVDELPPGAQSAHYLGWVNLDEDRRSKITADFPSFFHQSRLSYLLHGSQALTAEVEAMTLQQFIVEVIRSFSANALRHPEHHTTGSHRRRSIPEAQWQNEVYRGAYKVTGGHGLWLSPEFGTGQTASRLGRIDFYVMGSKGWGIEILREGDRIEDHMERFQSGGAYHTSIQNKTMKEYAVLDFRASTAARKKYPQHRNLYHISFDEGFQQFCIVNCNLEEVASGGLKASD